MANTFKNIKKTAAETTDGRETPSGKKPRPELVEMKPREEKSKLLCEERKLC